MRKVFCIFLILAGLLVYMFGVEMADQLSITPWVHNNTTEILVVQDEYIPDGEFFTHFRNVQEQFGVYIFQAIWRDGGKLISIYTTDTTLDGKVTLSTGVFPFQHADGFISNKQTQDISQAGRFRHFTTQERHVVIYPIEELAEQAGLGGIFFLNTTDEETVAQIIRYLEESLIGSVQIWATHGALNHMDLLSWTASLNRPLSALVGIVCILFAVIAVKYILSMSKQSALMFIEGFSKERIAIEHLLGVLPIFLFSFLLVSACILAYLIMNSSASFWWMFIRSNIIFHIAVLALFLVMAYYLVAHQTDKSKAVMVIAGKRQDTGLTIMHFSAKCVVLIMIVSAFLQLQEQSAYLHERQRADLNWRQAENVYTTGMRVASDMGCNISRRPVEIRSKDLFKELNEELNLFLIYAYNFQLMEDGRYLWEWTSTDEFSSIHSLNGRSIIINDNYLHRHPLYAADGLPATEHLVYDQFVQNVLVPVSLSSHEAEIYETFLHSFHESRVAVANYYNMEMGQPLDDTPVELLSINIIFVEDGAWYFTYDPKLASSTHNMITDPIAVVDTLNLDASYYEAWFSSSAFFESSGGKPLEELRPYVVRNDMGTSLNVVNSVYELHAESIRETENNLRILFLVGIALLSAFIFSIYAFIASYYEQHKYAIYIKRIFGYSYARCNWQILVFGTGLTMLLLIPVAWYIVAALAVIEILLIMLFSNAIGNKSFSEIAKGVH